MERKFIKLDIYKNRGDDFSNGGLSSKYDSCYIESPRGWLSEKDINQDAIVELVDNAFGTIALKPVKPVEKGCVGYMMGGCYVASSDSRFSELVEKKLGIRSWHGAVALHDRTETYDDYERYSN